jgi:catechol 2,3-dioxygenase-like lactoylglutathione lyase family enzyme
MLAACLWAKRRGERVDIRGLDHAALLVSDVEISRRFYGEVLALDEVPRPPSFTFPGAWFRRGSAEVHLIGEERRGRAAEMRADYHADELERGYATHIAFEVTDLQVTQDHLEAHDVQLAGGPRPRGDGVQQIYVRDPDGHVVELFAREAP